MKEITLNGHAFEFPIDYRPSGLSGSIWFRKSVYVILSSFDGSLTSKSVEGIQPFFIRTSFIDLNPHY